MPLTAATNRRLPLALHYGEMASPLTRPTYDSRMEEARGPARAGNLKASILHCSQALLPPSDLAIKSKLSRPEHRSLFPLGVAGQAASPASTPGLPMIVSMSCLMAPLESCEAANESR